MTNQRVNLSAAPQYRLVLAPLRGITGATFRNAFAHHFDGFHAAVTPFIATTAGNRASLRHFADILPENNRSWELVPQLIGNNPRDFIQATAQIHDLGYTCVNWNLGCPSPTVTRKSRGCALLSQPQRVKRFLDQVVPALPCALSIKTRLGFEHADELAVLLPDLNTYPLAELIIHPRTGKQMFAAPIDHARYGECLRACSHPVVYNGNITTVETFASLQSRFRGTSAWMIGRGAVANPFLPLLIAGRSLPDSPLDRLKSFHDELYRRYREELFGPAPVLGRMKELWEYLAGSFDGGEKLLNRIRRATRMNVYETCVEEFFDAAVPRLRDTSAPEQSGLRPDHVD